MAFGGGIWLTQNKVLPGTYINFISVAKASATLSDRGVAALPMPLPWGPEGTVFEVTNGDFQKNSMNIFGYTYDAPAMLPLRELFRNTKTAFLYRLTGTSVKAVCTVSGVSVATALYGGTRGNSLRLVVTANVDAPEAFDVSLLMDDVLVHTQSNVASSTDLAPNQFVAWNAEASLEATAGTPFAGGDDGTITGLSHQTALDRLESYSFNTLGCTATDDITKALYAQYTKRMRDETGAKFQLVAHRVPADYEGVISVENDVDETAHAGKQGLVYFVLGMEAACPVNRSCTNRKYDGELSIQADYTQKQLEDAIKAGKLIFHNAGGSMCVLDDINTLVTLSVEKGADFQSNQTIRVCDQIANDAALTFNTRYAGIVPNDKAGRADLWNDLCKLIQLLEKIRAVENFDTKTATVEQGETKKAVLFSLNNLNVTNAMAQLYMAVYIQ